VLPPIEDAQKSAAIPLSCPRVWPAYKDRGKGRKQGNRGKGPEIPLDARIILDICSNNEEEFCIYCFCCPALSRDNYEFLYTPPASSTIKGVLSAKEKDVGTMFMECAIQKEKGEKFINDTGPSLFHSEPELHCFFINASAATVGHLDYGQDKTMTGPEGWLVNMLMDEDAGWGASEVQDTPEDDPTSPTSCNIIEEANSAISGWKDVCRNVTVHLLEGGVSRLTNPDGSLVTLLALRQDRPAREGIALDRNAGGTKHVLVIGHQAHHLGWTGHSTNQFSPIANPAQAEDPSEDLNA
jgi:hypothetical protein